MTRPADHGSGPRVDAVILDLGGVICAFDFDRAYRFWSPLLAMPPDEIRRRVTADWEVFHAFERGEIEVGGVLDEVNRRIGVPLTLESFIQGWNHIFLDRCPGIHELIRALATRTRLVALSNTNAVHAAFWRGHYADTLLPIDRIFVSNEIGARKPEPAAYRAVLEYLELPPERTAFFDDVPEFVAGGRAVGIHAFVVESTASIRRDLATLGIALPDDTASSA